MSNAWATKEPEYKKAVGMVAELEAWGDREAGSFRSGLNSSELHLNDKDFATAGQILDAVTAALGPVHETYQRQRAANKQYDPLVKELEPKLVAVAQCRSANLVPLQQEIAEMRTRLETAIGSKDFVAAVQCVTELSPKVAECLAKKQELESQKKQFEDGVARLQPRLSEASYGRYAKLAPIQDEIRSVHWQIESASQSEDWEQGLALLRDLSTKVDAYFSAKQELELKRKDYEEARGTVDKRLAELAGGDFKKLTEMKSDLVVALTQIEAAVQSEDFEQAAALVEELTSQVDAYVSTKSTLESDKSDYESLKSDLESRWEDVPQPVYQMLEPMYDELRSLQSEMESAAQSEAYDEAVMHGRSLLSQIDAYTATKDNLDSKKEEYEEIHGTLEFRLDEAVQSESQSPLQEEIASLKSQMEAAVASDDYEEAVAVARELFCKVDDYFAATEGAEGQEVSSEDMLAESQSGTEELGHADESESTETQDEFAAEEDASSERV